MTSNATAPAYTPGPWLISAIEPGRHMIALADWSPIATVGDGPHEGDPETAEANARLIAAAPDQNDALSKIVKAIEDMLEDDSLQITSDCGDLLLQLATIGNAAIAQAEGRE